ncbi:3-ketoacyl-(acyl-carrier-protein) reductase [Thermoplasmatales archaeon]|nr:3-ketoacyl-(acyl-carrier-protein) reductase [Thermoplasmatales archaeon]
MDVIRESLAGKVAVVMGAGPGQGNAVARLLINFGAKIAMVSRSGSSFGLVESSTIKIFKGDATNEDSIKEIRDKIIDFYGGIDVVYNSPGKYEETSKDFPPQSDLMEMFTSNVGAQYNVIRLFSESMRKKGGSIVNIGASPAIFTGSSIAYTVAKKSIEEMTRKSAEMLKPYNIRVNAVLPGAVSREDRFRKTFPFNFAKISDTTDMEATEVAYVSVFLLSEMAYGINGQSIVVDKGMNTLRLSRK